ncbi:uncharacterized protein LOC6558892 [Drosophila grimshawi]|uniref:GH16370 n=1 Tax=Drosophila grimshawi TaxID=7222 RepID=B4IYV4_DROGR|nr:uncharacterized protein LOC6558892 [Drosophila grimshawi]EDV96641.1 GH16370 [Drosophila grimshawi]
MARYQLISSLLLGLVILVAQTTAEAPRRLRYNRQRQAAFARQEIQPTPYPTAEELKPEEPVLIYGPPPSTDVDELPAEQELPTNSFQPDAETDIDVDNAEALDNEETAPELTTPAAFARLRISRRQKLAKLQLAKVQPNRQRIARLEAVPVPAEAPLPAVPQFYYVGGQQQQAYLVAYNPANQQLAW